MSRKDKDQLNEQEPWDQPIFEEEVGSDDDGSSRADRRFKEEGKNWYVIILVVLLFLIVLIPTAAILYMKTGSNLNEGTPKADKVVVESSTKEKVTKSSSSEKTTESTSKTEGSSSSSLSSSSSSSSSTTSSTFKDVEVTPDEAKNNQNVVPEGTQSAGPGSTVTFGEGENISVWRIAQNNGVSEEQIYQLNPGLTSQNIQPGQQIRIK